MRGILVGEDKLIAEWCYKTFNLFVMPVNCAVGIVNSDGKLVGAALFQNFNGTNIELSYYGHNTLTYGIIRALAKVATDTFNVSRCTVITSKRNRRLMKSLVKIGFRLEGVQRCFYGHRDSSKNVGVRFVMFRDRINDIAAGSHIKKVA